LPAKHQVSKALKIMDQRSYRRVLRQIGQGQSGLRLVGLTMLGWLWASLVGGTPEFRPLSTTLPEPGIDLMQYDPAAQATDVNTQTGTQVKLNGRMLNLAWQRRSEQIGIADLDLAAKMGPQLLNTAVPTQQPVEWFSSAPRVLPAWQSGPTRYLDISSLAAEFGWQIKTLGNVLELSTRPAQVSAIRQGRQDWGDRIVVDLNQPALWEVEETATGTTIRLDAAIAPALQSAFVSRPGRWVKQLQVAQAGQQTVLTIAVTDGVRPRTWSLSNPNRLVIDFRQDDMPERDIAWAPGLRWQQRYVALGSSRFPVYSLTLDPKQQMASLLPIWSNATTATGTSPLITMARQWQAAAVINGGFFNRNNQLPLGALRYDSRWISGPILGRGAIAWDGDGRLLMDRLSLSQVITTAAGRAFSVLTINSGYVQAGVSLYTPDWGATYTPLVDNEIVVTVRNQQVVQQQRLATAGSGTVPIPRDGYLLALRSDSTTAAALPPGTELALSSQAQPTAFEQYPHVMGAGPLLLRNRQIVLDAKQEGFSPNFIQGTAPRSVMGVTENGEWLIVAIQNRVGGRGPTLSETAQLMQRLGCIDALNLDGGSSSSLYLNGSLLNRHPRTAARVHNGLGIFISQ
jgi:hypothetical protein